MTTDLEKQFFETFGIEPRDNFKGCESGITFYTYGCNMPSCKGCSKEIRQKEYPQISDRILLELICIIQQLKDVDYLKEFVLKYITDLYRTNSESVSNTDRYQTIAKDIKHQVRTLFKEV